MKKFLASLFPYLFSICLVFLFHYFVASFYKVSGESMVPSLQDGERVLVQKIGYHLKPGDILIVKNPVNPDELIVKRLIAKEGDLLEVKNGLLHRNGKLVKEPYIYRDSLLNFDKVLVPPNMIFVLGDHREVSLDSRIFGFVPEDLIVGKVVWKIF